MFFAIRHLTRFRYDRPVSENFTEIRKKPVSDESQTCLAFELVTAPSARVFAYTDGWGNAVHHFNLLRPHTKLEIVSEAVVEIAERPVPTPDDFAPADWERIDALLADGEFWHFTHESRYIRFSEPVRQLAGVCPPPDRQTDPLSWLLALNESLYSRFAYRPNLTGVDSQIEEFLDHGAGVCQDFAHLMLALVRLGGIPARYTSGYLFHRTGAHDRSEEDASHAWIEAYLPRWGWIGFDPTNNLLVKQRHIRVATGRDYSDVPPSRGVFTGQAESQLEVSVTVTPTTQPAAVRPEGVQPTGWAAEDSPVRQMQQMQQQ